MNLIKPERKGGALSSSSLFWEDDQIKKASAINYYSKIRILSQEGLIAKEAQYNTIYRRTYVVVVYVEDNYGKGNCTSGTPGNSQLVEKVYGTVKRERHEYEKKVILQRKKVNDLQNNMQ